MHRAALLVPEADTSAPSGELLLSQAVRALVKHAPGESLAPQRFVTAVMQELGGGAAPGLGLYRVLLAALDEACVSQVAMQQGLSNELIERYTALSQLEQRTSQVSLDGGSPLATLLSDFVDGVRTT